MLNKRGVFYQPSHGVGKRGQWELEQLVKYILWIAFFIILLTGLYYLLRYFGVMAK